MTPPDTEQPQFRNTTSKLQDVIASAKANVREAESRELEEFLTEYGVIFAMKIDVYIQTHSMYYRINMGEARPIRQLPKRLP
jgi:hypothetical protein